mgnify:CR=1 FL=1
MTSRFVYVLVMFAALLQASPVVPSSYRIRIEAAIECSVNEAREEQHDEPRAQFRRAAPERPAQAQTGVPADLAFSLFQRPPPSVS